MLDPQVEAVQEMVDDDRGAHRHARRLAERHSRHPGEEPAPGTTTRSAARRHAHLGALDLVYSGVIADHRGAIDKTEEPDPVTQDMLIDQSGQLEQFHWFVRAHLETPTAPVTDGADARSRGREGRQDVCGTERAGGPSSGCPVPRGGSAGRFVGVSRGRRDVAVMRLMSLSYPLCDRLPRPRDRSDGEHRTAVRSGQVGEVGPDAVRRRAGDSGT